MHLLPFHDDGSDLTQIFIHGYEGVQSRRDLQQLVAYIGRARPAGRCILVCWGGWLQNKLRDQPNSHPSDASTAWERLASTAGQILRDSSDGKSHAWLNGIGAAAQETLRFWSHTEEAEQAGRRLHTAWHSESTPTEPFDRSRLHLWGHSLGARVLMSALAASIENSSRRTLQIERSVMLGAAASAAPDQWEMATAACHHVTNVYSTSDLVLRVAPLWDALAGLRPIDVPRVQNVEMPFGHNDYWPGFERVANAVDIETTAGQYTGLVVSRCPQCETSQVTVAEQPTQCARCGNAFQPFHDGA